jgi:hypothetical protein
MKKLTVSLTFVMTLFASFVLSQETQVFQNPTFEGKRLDVCLVWGDQCGQAAADAWCKTQGFDGAFAFEVDKAIGAQTPTIVMTDRKICDQPNCDGFKTITCKRAKSVTPQPPLRRVPGPGKNTPNSIGTDPDEFIIVFPKKPDAILGRFGTKASIGELEERRDVPLKTTADLIQTVAADFDGDGQSDLAILEVPDPLKPGNADLQFFTLTPDLNFTRTGQSGTAWISLPLLVSGRFLGNGKQQALLYTVGSTAAIVESNGDLAQIENWVPKGASFTFDANGDGRDELLEYIEATGLLNFVSFGAVQLKNGDKVVPATVTGAASIGSGGLRFAVGDFTGDGRMDLLIHDTKSSLAVMAMFDTNGKLIDTNPVATDWPTTYTWSRGFDYDGDGRDDLLVAQPGVMVALARFTAAGGLRELKVLGESVNTENLRFPGLFMANGRASFLSYVRQENRMSHIWFSVNGDEIVLPPSSSNLINQLPDGGFVVVGNFVKGR